MFSVGLVFTQSVRIVRRNSGTFGLFLAILTLTTLLLGLASRPGLLGLLDPRWFNIVKFGLYAVTMAVSAAIDGAIIVLTFRDLNGDAVGPGSALRAGVPFTVPLLAMTLATSIAIGFGLILLIVPGVLLLVRWQVAGPARVIEGPGLREALRRSAVLTNGHRGAILGLFALYCLAIATQSGVSGLLSLPDAISFGSAFQMKIEPLYIAKAVAAAVLTQLLAIASSTVGAVTYAELRRTKEGGLTDDIAALFE